MFAGILMIKSEEDARAIQLPKTFCPFPWAMLTVMPSGTIHPCCIAPPILDENRKPVRVSENGQSLLEVWNHKQLKLIRQSMMAGKWPSSCQSCSHFESRNILSRRQRRLKFWQNFLDTDFQFLLSMTESDGHLPILPESFDLRLGNVCNLSCIMCKPFFSSAWMRVLPKIKDLVSKTQLASSQMIRPLSYLENASVDQQTSERLIQWVLELAPGLTKLQFGAGEPLLSKYHDVLLTELARSGESEHVVLWYNLNGTYLPKDVLSLWSRFKKVYLYLSADGVGEAFSYIRTPARWEIFASNVERLLRNNPGSWNVTFTYTLQFLNCHTVVDFLKWINTLEPLFEQHNGFHLVEWNCVGRPECLSPQALPDDVKLEIIIKVERELREFTELNPRWRGHPVIHTLRQKLEYHLKYGRGESKVPVSETFTYLDILDQVHGGDWRQTFPWLANKITSKR